MANHCYRIYGSPKSKNKKNINRGRKKKARRISWAAAKDGGRRKRANSLSPAFRPSKKYIDMEID